MIEEDKRVKQLHRLRGALKAKLTVLDKFLNKARADIDLIDLNGKCTDVERVKTDFEITQNEIESIVSNAAIDSKYAERIEFEKRFSYLTAQAERILREKEPIITIDQSSSLSRVSDNIGSITSLQENALISATTRVHCAGNSINLKSPALNLPSFSGTCETWSGFSNTFKSSVHNDSKYANSQKLLYLRSCLTGKDAEKIKSLATTDANYQVAWDILEKYYNDPPAVINNHVKAFFDLS
ncbi:uncharacterized protein LOC117180536 [Belonocnema kinseyi]|uniref:uncharacterized protein LOC117180536 n=1 Tax=Belonocnema kinseyi TaxID=2817044 RepID=UPI00143D7313|nr:uncharacterized protein LOC117180536 [Belonocnema kinseyi]